MIDFKDISGRVFIIAEIGVNHEGDFSQAEQMISLAAKSGADAVKFQTYLAEEYISLSQRERLERVKKFQLSFEQFRELACRAKEEKVVFISTPLGFESLNLVNELCPIIKISSGDITNYPLLRRAAATGKMIILSTGVSTVEEIEKAVRVMKESNSLIISERKLILLHCIAAYPAPEDEVNLLSVPYLKDKFNLPVGYSDHTKGILASQAAVALGACVVEKHFTYSKQGQTFHDHYLSADPSEFKEMAEGIRRIEKMRGVWGKNPVASEEQFKNHIRRSLSAARDLMPGETLSLGDICLLRPGSGITIEEMDSVLGKTVKKEIFKGQMIFREDLSEGDKNLGGK